MTINNLKNRAILIISVMALGMASHAMEDEDCAIYCDLYTDKVLMNKFSRELEKQIHSFVMPPVDHQFLFTMCIVLDAAHSASEEIAESAMEIVGAAAYDLVKSNITQINPEYIEPEGIEESSLAIKKAVKMVYDELVSIGMGACWNKLIQVAKDIFYTNKNILISRRIPSEASLKRHAINVSTNARYHTKCMIIDALKSKIKITKNLENPLVNMLVLDDRMLVRAVNEKSDVKGLSRSLYTFSNIELIVDTCCRSVNYFVLNYVVINFENISREGKLSEHMCGGKHSEKICQQLEYKPCINNFNEWRKNLQKWQEYFVYDGPMLSKEKMRFLTTWLAPVDKTFSYPIVLFKLGTSDSNSILRGFPDDLIAYILFLALASD